MMDVYLRGSFEEAKKGLEEGGIPIGAVLVYNDRILGKGRNQRVQKGSVINHAEMNAFENAGRQPSTVYKDCTLYTTLSPCVMCSGAVLLYKIPKVVIGENQTFQGEEEWLEENGVEVRVLDDTHCRRLMQHFIRINPGLWNEDIGV